MQEKYINNKENFTNMEKGTFTHSLKEKSEKKKNQYLN